MGTSAKLQGQPSGPAQPESAGASGLSLPAEECQDHPANQLWAADITYLPMARVFLYLVVVMDCHSRYVVA